MSISPLEWRKRCGPSLRWRVFGGTRTGGARDSGTTRGASPDQPTECSLLRSLATKPNAQRVAWGQEVAELGQSNRGASSRYLARPGRVQLKVHALEY
jgi:hypothetical protein